MQAIIFAAGRGTRMGNLTDALPKPMLEVAGKPILEHKLEELPSAIDEVILVVGYLGSVIQKYFGGEFGGRRMLYVEQENPVAGTADALWCAKGIAKGRFLAMNGDDLYARADLTQCITSDSWALLVQQREVIGSGGKVELDARGSVRDIEEGTHRENGFANAGVYALDDRIFSQPLVRKAPDSEEYGLPQTVVAASRALDVPLVPVRASRWCQITAPDDLRTAEEFIRG